MSRINHCFGGQDEQTAANVFAQFVEIASSQVSPSDAAVEEYVAAEDAVVCFTVVHQAAGRVSGHVDGFQLRVSEGDEVAIAQVVTQGNGWLRQLEAEHARLSRCLFQPKLVGLVRFGLQTEFLFQKRITEDMVQVKVRIQQMLHGKAVRLDVFLQCLLLFVIEAACIDDDCFLRIVRQDVAVHREHIEFKNLDFHEA